MKIKLNKHKNSFLLRSIILFLILVLSGCATTKYKMDYEVDPDTAQVWPGPPEIPRFRFVGALTGEQNVTEIEESKSFGTKIADFFKMLVGIKGVFLVGAGVGAAWFLLLLFGLGKIHMIKSHKKGG